MADRPLVGNYDYLPPLGVTSAVAVAGFTTFVAALNDGRPRTVTSIKASGDGAFSYALRCLSSVGALVWQYPAHGGLDYVGDGTRSVQDHQVEFGCPVGSVIQWLTPEAAPRVRGVQLTLVHGMAHDG